MCWQVLSRLVLFDTQVPCSVVIFGLASAKFGCPSGPTMARFEPHFRLTNAQLGLPVSVPVVLRELVWMVQRELSTLFHQWRGEVIFVDESGIVGLLLLNAASTLWGSCYASTGMLHMKSLPRHCSFEDATTINMGNVTQGKGFRTTKCYTLVGRTVSFYFVGIKGRLALWSVCKAARPVVWEGPNLWNLKDLPRAVIRYPFAKCRVRGRGCPSVCLVVPIPPPPAPSQGVKASTKYQLANHYVCMVCKPFQSTKDAGLRKEPPSRSASPRANRKGPGNCHRVCGRSPIALSAMCCSAALWCAVCKTCARGCGSIVI